MKTTEQLLDVIGLYMEQSVARSVVTADEAIRAVRELEAVLPDLRERAMGAAALAVQLAQALEEVAYLRQCMRDAGLVVAP